MNFNQETAFSIVWFAVIFAETWLLAVLFLRRSFKDYPAFSAFLCFCVARSFLLLYFSRHYTFFYQPVKWIAYFPQSAILIAVVLEVLYLMFHPFDALPAKTIQHFGLATGFVITIAVVFAIFHPGAQPTAWMTFARAADQAVSWVLCSVFIFVVLFASYFGIPWRHRIYGIALGFLFYLSVDVAVTTIVAQLRLPPFSPVWLLDMFGFFTACLIWNYYFRRAEISRSVPTYEQIQRVRSVLGQFGNVLENSKLRKQEDYRS